MRNRPASVSPIVGMRASVLDALASVPMFATLGGAMPRPVLSGDPGSPVLGQRAADRAADEDVEDRLVGLIREAIALQEEAGLEPVTDGGLRHEDAAAWLLGGMTGVLVRANRAAELQALPAWSGPITVDEWGVAAGCTARAVKQSIVGPYTLARGIEPGSHGREAVTLAVAEALNAELRALAAAGCPLVQVDEDDAIAIGESPSERRLFGEAQRRLLEGVGDVHASLAIRGGNADAAGAATILDAPYRSYLFDLCAGPDNWRLVVNVPGDRGVIAGAADARSARVDELEVLAFAIGYAASTGGRGHDRVGVATSGDMAGIGQEAAAAKIRRLGEAAAAYAGPPGSLARAMDPQAIDIRSAALGRYEPPPRDPPAR
jgi:methionine synthase II (cobalamin-independent)